MEYTLAGSVKPETAIKPQTVAGAITGQTIDSKDFLSLTFIVSTGDLSSTVNITVEHADNADMSDAATVPADLMYGSIPALTKSGYADTQIWLGYFGKKRYVRLKLTSGGGDVSAVALLGHAEQAPTLGPDADAQFAKYG